MQINTFYNNLINQTAEILLTSPVLSRINQLPIPQLHFFFSQLYYFVEIFPGLIGMLIWQTNHQEIRFVLIENLIDECGGFEKIKDKNFSGMHSNLLKKFITLTGMGNVLAKKSIHTEALINNINKLFLNSSLIEILGILTCMESVSTDWFNLLYRQLKERHEFNEDDLYFFKLHTEIDEEHSYVLKEILMPLLTKQEDLILLQNAALNSVNNWRNFYQDIDNELNSVFQEKTCIR